MAPDKRPRARRTVPLPKAAVRTRPSADDVHDVVFFRRHPADDPAESEPGRDFLNGCPTKVRATMRAVLADPGSAVAGHMRRLAGAKAQVSGL
jgi:hypothetical protein